MLQVVIAHEADKEKLPAQFYRDERARLVRAAHAADAEAIAAVTDYQIAAMA